MKTVNRTTQNTMNFGVSRIRMLMHIRIKKKSRNLKLRALLPLSGFMLLSIYSLWGSSTGHLLLKVTSKSVKENPICVKTRQCKPNVDATWECVLSNQSAGNVILNFRNSAVSEKKSNVHFHIPPMKHRCFKKILSAHKTMFIRLKVLWDKTPRENELWDSCAILLFITCEILIQI